MIKLAGIGHVLLRVADEEASKRFYRDVLGFRVAEQDPEHGGVFMTLGDGFHAIDMTQAPEEAARPEPRQLGLVHIAFKVASYAALRDAYAHLLDKASRSSARSTTSASAASISPTPTATGSKSITRCRMRCPCSRTAAATRTSACRYRAPANPCPPGSPKTGPDRPRWRRSRRLAQGTVAAAAE